MSLRLANAPCSWGVLEFDLPGEALGYAQVLDEIRDTGYAGTELGNWGFMPTDSVALRGELEVRNLSMVGAFVPVAFANESAHPAGEEAALKTARLLAATVGRRIDEVRGLGRNADCQSAASPTASRQNASSSGLHEDSAHPQAGQSPFIVLADDNGIDPARTKRAGRITEAESLTGSQWATFAKGVERIALAVREQTGLRSVFHHHCAGFVETPDEVARLLQLTDPGLLGLCFDTGHYRFGGGEPLAGLKRHRDRVWHVHYKDCSPSVHAQSRIGQWNYFESLKHGIFCELGKGDIDFAAITAELRRTNYTGWIVVEQDVLPGTGAPREYAQRNRDFLKSCRI